MAASMASLANPVGDAVPETALGAFFECLCLAIELCASGGGGFSGAKMERFSGKYDEL